MGRREESPEQAKTCGISFELATLIFEDEGCLVYMDRIDNHTGEQRWIALGMVQPAPDAAILLVAIGSILLRSPDNSNPLQ
jgi:uncharacterized DUF497 family protein